MMNKNGKENEIMYPYTRVKLRTSSGVTEMIHGILRGFLLSSFSEFPLYMYINHQ